MERRVRKDQADTFKAARPNIGVMAQFDPWSASGFMADSPPGSNLVIITFPPVGNDADLTR
jgi:hypothetical protein